VEEFMQDLGQKMISIGMNMEPEFKEMFCSNASNFMNNSSIEIIDILTSEEDIEDRDIMKYEIIDETQERLISKYEQIKLDMTSKDPRLISDNGSITQIIYFKKFWKSMLIWLSKSQQYQYKNLAQSLFLNFKKG